MTRRLLAAVAVLTALTVAAPPAAAASSVTVRVWSWNVAGHTMHRGSTTDGLIPAATSSIVNRDADVVMLQELCEQQYTALIGSLRAAGWPEDPDNFARFEPNLSGASAVCGGRGFGIAVLLRGGAGSAQRVVLPDDDTPESHRVLCVPFAAQPLLRACTTHITASNTVAADGRKVNERQLQAALAVADGHTAAGRTVLVGGDLNAQPSYGRLNGWYSPTVDTAVNGSNSGAYRELDDTDTRCPGYGEGTAVGSTGSPCTDPQTKIDHVFVAEDRVAGAYSGDALAVPTTCTIGACSDHRVYTGIAPLRVG